MENQHTAQRASFYYPPGGILLWVIIFIELLTFGIALIAFTYQGRTQLDIYRSSCEAQHVLFAFINTLILLSSGFCMAEAVRLNKLQDARKTKLWLIATQVLGCIFIALKLLDYISKIQQGIGLETNTYYMYYWLLTAFHFFHVILGLIFLFILFIQHANSYKEETYQTNLESAAVFWHLCDLIWLLLFPVLFLYFRIA